MVIKSVGYLSLILGLVLPATASLANVPSLIKNSVNSPIEISLKFPPAPNGEGPVSTAGGGTRGGTCRKGNTKLTALVPSKKTLTVSPNPTFFVYIPQSQPTSTGEFSLVDIDQKNNLVYKTMIQLPTEPSIVPIALPKTVALKVGTQYKWQVSIVCEIPGRSESNDNTTDFGEDVIAIYIQRNELTTQLKKELEQTKDLLKQAEIYARENIWQDTLMSVAQLRNSQQQEWKNLLNSIKIEQPIIEAPFALKATMSNSGN
jgi:hypothetical protein